MKHPITTLMQAVMGSANSIVVHRAVIRAFRDAGCPSALEAAALWEHMVFLQTQQGEWVVFPQSEAEEALFIPERTIQRLTAWLKENGLIETRRRLTIYQGNSGNFQQYRPNLEALATLLGCELPEGGTGGFEGADLAGSKPRDLAGSTITNKREKSGRTDAPRSPSKSGVGSEENKQGNGNTESGAARLRNPHFDAIVAALYPQGVGSNGGHIRKVAGALEAAGWTPEQITAVLRWRLSEDRDGFWKKNLSLGSFEKNAEDWKRSSGVSRRAPAPLSEIDNEDVTEGLF